MLPPTNVLMLAIFLHDSLESQHILGRIITGILPLGIDFQLFVSALENAGILVSENISIRELEFRFPQTADDSFYLSVEELLSSIVRRVNPPARFYVAELKYLHENNNATPPLEIQSYFDACALFNLMRGVADHSNDSDNTLVFWEKRKIILTSEYSRSELTPLLGLPELKSDFFCSSIHSKQKHTIIRSAFLEEFNSKNIVKMGIFLKRFDNFFERIISNYELYVSEFSFEKIKAEIEKDKLEFTTKLNKVFADIQNQLLAIPVAVLLVGGQMENTNSWTLKNSLIWAGALFFCILMNLLIRNQRNTLAAINNEILQQWQQIQGRHSSVADRFKPSYIQLKVRYRHQERLIRVISVMVSFALAVATSLYIYYSVSKPVVYTSGLISAAVLLLGLIFMLMRWWYNLSKIDNEFL